MKRLLVLIACTTLHFQCSKDSDPSPVDSPDSQSLTDPSLSATVEGSTDGKFFGVVAAPETGQVKTLMTIKAPAGFKSMEVRKVNGDTKQLIHEIVAGDPNYDGKTQFEYPYHYKLTNDDAGQKFFFEAVITDKQDRKSAAVKLIQVEGRAPMSFFLPSLATSLPASGLLRVKHYLLADNYVYGATFGDIDTDKSYNKVEMVFSVNDASGYYLSSPNATAEESLTTQFPAVNISQLKVASMSAAEFSALSKFDPYAVEDLFNKTVAGANPGKAEKIGKGKVVVFRTHNNRAGVLLVTDFTLDTTSEPHEASIEMQLWIGESVSN
jgi:hypothetical protein